MGRRPLCVCLLIFLAVYLAIYSRVEEKKAGSQTSYNGQQMELTGIVQKIDVPLADQGDAYVLYLDQAKKLILATDLYSENQLFHSSISNHQKEKQQKEKQQKVICYLDRGQRLPRIGSAVKIKGQAYSFSRASNPGEFDAAAYYELRGYTFTLRKAQLLAESESYDRAGEFFFEQRCRLGQLYIQILGKKNGALAAAMVLGLKKDVDDTVKSLYQSAGIAHILSISGLHVSLVGSSLIACLKKMNLPLAAASLIGMILIAGYGMFTGMSVSTLRAVVMILLVLTASMLVRTADMPTSLGVAMAVVLLQNPGYWKDSGFQLSFSAVMGIAWVVPVLKERDTRRREASFWGKILTKGYDAFCVTVGVTLTMLPFLLCHFYTWNPWSLFFNPIAVFLTGLLLPLLFGLAGAGLLIGQIKGGAALLQILALPAGWMFEFLEKTSAFLQKLPAGCLHIGMPKVWQLVLFGTGLVLLTVLGKRLRPGLRLVGAAVLMCVFLLQFPGNLKITMLDVGQGACFVVQSPQNQFYLVDAGSSSKKGTGNYQIVPYLKYSGADRIEAVFISHWDEDHISGLEDIFAWAAFEQVEVRRMILPDIAFQDEAHKKLLDLAQKYQIPTGVMKAGEIWEEGELSFSCLHPYEGETVTDRNAASMVLKLQYEAFGALFPGDLEKEQEQWLLDAYSKELLQTEEDCDENKNSSGMLSSTLLMAAHHGSSTSNSEAFLTAVGPKAVFISCGRNNSYGHPHQEVLKRLKVQKISWYGTHQRGAVWAEIQKGKMKIESFL